MFRENERGGGRSNNIVNDKRNDSDEYGQSKIADDERGGYMYTLYD